MPTVFFKVHGMDCAEEIATLRKELAPIPGIQNLAFDVLNGRMTVQYAEGMVEPREIGVAVGRTGMRVEPWRERGRQSEAVDRRGQGARLVITILSGLLTGLGFVAHGICTSWYAAVTGQEHSPVPPLALALYLAAVVAGGWFVVPKAWLALRRFRADMNLLMTIAVIGAVAIGQYFEAATVAFLFALSLTLESWSVSRARRAVAALMELSPVRARVISSTGVEEEMDVGLVKVASRMLIRPGEKFPLDGQIVQGQTTVNQAPITGESMPIPKQPGDEVFAGTLNDDGAVEVVTTRLADDTILARIIRMVTEAQSRRAKSQQQVETFAHYYTPSVMLLAMAVAFVPPLFFGGAWAKWFYESLVLLVIACPCALVISTPVSIVSALASAARHGVLIKGGLFIELPARLRAVALDKTGTLTEGHPRVQQIVPLNGHTERELLEIAGAIESRSEHPLARAILRYAADSGFAAVAAEDFQALRGRGATAVLNGRPVWIGSHRLLEERMQETPDLHDRLEKLAAKGLSILVIGNDEHVCGFIAVGDRVRADARSVVADLRAAGIEHVIMLTGDNQATAETIASQTGVDQARWNLLPDDKVRAVEELVDQYGMVAMVGDGVNDAPAMARSSLSIAMGAMGTDVAIETADIALMADDLSRLPWLVRHSRRTLGIIRQNIAASLGVKAVFVVLTLTGHASLWAAIAADMGVSLLVVFNALRLLGDGRDSASGAGSSVSSR